MNICAKYNIYILLSVLVLVLYLGLSPGVSHAVHGPGEPLALADMPGGGEEGEHPGQHQVVVGGDHRHTRHRARHVLRRQLGHVLWL